MSYAQAYRQQVKEAFLDPNSKCPVGYSLEPCDWVFWKHHQRKVALEPHWKGPCQVLLTTDTAAKLEGTEPWIHISRSKKASPDSWSCTDAGDLWVKLMRKRSSWHQRRPLSPNSPDQDFTLKPKTKSFLLFLFLYSGIGLERWWRQLHHPGHC